MIMNHEHVCMYEHARARARACVYMHVRVVVRARARACARACVCVLVCVPVFVHARAHVCSYCVCLFVGLFVCFVFVSLLCFILAAWSLLCDNYNARDTHEYIPGKLLCIILLRGPFR